MERCLPKNEKLSVRTISKKSFSNRGSHFSNLRRVARYIDESASKYSVSIKSSTYRTSNVRNFFKKIIWKIFFNPELVKLINESNIV